MQAFQAAASSSKDRSYNGPRALETEASTLDSMTPHSPLSRQLNQYKWHKSVLLVAVRMLPINADTTSMTTGKADIARVNEVFS